jgi:hypothetical protein
VVIQSVLVILTDLIGDAIIVSDASAVLPCSILSPINRSNGYGSFGTEGYPS